MVTVGNVITSMRLLSSSDWRAFVESVSLVDPVLADDPALAYSRMDFATRDRYRHVIEKIAKRVKVSRLKLRKRRWRWLERQLSKSSWTRASITLATI
ncbi:MAG: hypothetical protein WKF84_00880 [Pyrinomonadaceae bacterium]